MTMLKARSGNLILLGLDRENIKRLQEGSPIKFDGAQVGLDGVSVGIIYGETLLHIQRDLQKAGFALPDATNIRAPSAEQAPEQSSAPDRADIADIAAIIAGLGDDAAGLRRENPDCEIAANMDAAADLIESLQSSLVTARDLAEKASTALASTGYCIRHTDGRWMTLDTLGMPDWTNDPDRALCFRRREHADLFATDCGEPVRIVSGECEWVPSDAVILAADRERRGTLRQKDQRVLRLPDAPPNRELVTQRLRVAIQNAIHKLDAGATKAQIRLALTYALDDHRRSMVFVVYCDERAIDVTAVYANAGYPLPPNPTMTREQILRESDAGMDRTLIYSTGRIEDRVGVMPNEAVPLFDGMRFYTIPPAHY